MKSLIGDEDKLGDHASILSESILFMILFVFISEVVLSLVSKL